MLASADDLPDAFFGGNTLGDADIQKNPGLFIPLEDLIAENMPVLFAGGVSAMANRLGQLLKGRKQA